MDIKRRVHERFENFLSRWGGEGWKNSWLYCYEQLIFRGSRTPHSVPRECRNTVNREKVGARCSSSAADTTALIVIYFATQEAEQKKKATLWV